MCMHSVEQPGCCSNTAEVSLLTHALVLHAAQAKRIRGLFDKNQGLVSSPANAAVKSQCCA